MGELQNICDLNTHRKIDRYNTNLVLERLRTYGIEITIPVECRSLMPIDNNTHPKSLKKNETWDNKKKPQHRRPKLKLLRHYPKLFWTVYFIAILTGMLAYLSRTPQIETPVVPTFSAPEPGVEQNLAHKDAGAVVRVSTFDNRGGHHPLFAIDGFKRPHSIQKWVSHKKDRQPWIEVQLHTQAQVNKIRLVLAGAFERPVFSMSDYDIRCIRINYGMREVIAITSIRDNREARPEHELLCPDTDVIRIDFHVAKRGQPLDIVRLFEIEVWGAIEDK